MRPRWALNPRPPDYMSGALPSELPGPTSPLPAITCPGEMLACVFGAERFHTYVFGRSFTIESDHKPLEQINLKNLANTPARLQRMLLCLQNYDVKIIYCPGREMLVTDTLSQYAPMPAPEVALDLAIHHVHITPEKKLAFQQSIQDDPLLCSLAETIIAGWPEDIKDLPNALRPYHTY